MALAIETLLLLDLRETAIAISGPRRIPVPQHQGCAYRTRRKIPLLKMAQEIDLLAQQAFKDFESEGLGPELMQTRTARAGR